MARSAFIYDVMRTPRGKQRGGALRGTKPLDLVVGLLRELAPRNRGLELGRIDDIVLGVVSPVGEQGGDIARTAALVAGLRWRPEHLRTCPGCRWRLTGPARATSLAPRTARQASTWTLAR